MDEEKYGKKVKIRKRLLHWYGAYWHVYNTGIVPTKVMDLALMNLLTSWE